MILKGNDREYAVVYAVVQRADAIVSDPFEVEQLVRLQLLLDEQQGGKRETQPDEGDQPDRPFLEARLNTGHVVTLLCRVHSGTCAIRILEKEIDAHGLAVGTIAFCALPLTETGC